MALDAVRKFVRASSKVPGVSRVVPNYPSTKLWVIDVYLDLETEETRERLGDLDARLRGRLLPGEELLVRYKPEVPWRVIFNRNTY